MAITARREIRSPPRPVSPGRLRSVDVARGVAIAGMIVVNNQGNGSWAFPGAAHARWNGATPADLVFPTFLVVVGASMALSLDRRAATDPPVRLHLSILRRAATLVLIGLLLHGLFRVPFAELRLPGVLQRIGLAYVLAALVVLHVPRRRQPLLAGAVLVGYWAAMALVPVPGHGAGSLTPAGNLAGYLDRWVLGARHIYGNGPYDPEGLLATLPAVVTVLLGYWALGWLLAARRSGASARTSLGPLVTAGAALVLAGAAWHPFFPINKRLWTSSYVLFTGGFALLLLAATYWLVDLRGWRRAVRPFAAMGRNAIVVFVLAEQVAFELDRAGWRRWLWQHVFAPWAGPTFGSLGYALAFLGVCWLVCAGLDRRGWYLHV